MRIATIAAVVLACAARLCATTYYIDYAAGLDTNAGTHATSAWRHCPGDPAATDHAAGTPLAPGDVVRFKGGVTYVLTNGAGIELKWDGTPGQPVTYDGNRDGAWGSGRARFTDHHSSSGISAFSATALRRHLVFTSLEIGPMGGAATLPTDSGTAVPARFGGGIALRGGAVDVLVERSVFRELGYWFNQQPMDAASIAGAGIVIDDCRQVRVTECEFSRVARACDFSAASGIEDVKISKCSFGESIMWPIDVPLALRDRVSASQCNVAEDGKFERAFWNGYGEAPKTAVSIVATDSIVTWVADAIGTPAPTFQWLKNGIPVPGATNATFRIERASIADVGLYTAVASNSAGSTVSNTALLVVMPRFLLATLGTVSGEPSSSVPDPVAPAFTVQPADQLAAALESVTLSAEASGTPVPAYQWWKNGSMLEGATANALTLPSLTSAEVGNYFVVASNSAGSATSRTATVTLLAPPPQSAPAESPEPTTAPLTGMLLAANLVTVGDAPASMEFSVPGNVPRTVLVRAVGPTLAAFHLIGRVEDPRLEIQRDATLVAENDDWGGDAAVRNASSIVSVFPIVDPASKDAALLVTLAPGNYRAVVNGKAGQGGVAWVDAHALP